MLIVYRVTNSLFSALLELITYPLTQGFSTAGSRPGNGSWQILSGSFEGVWNLATKLMMIILSSGLYDQIDYVQNLTVHIKYLLDINSKFRYCYHSVIKIRLIT